VNQHIFRVDFPPEMFDRDFLCFALNENVASYIEQAQGGVGLAHITKAKLNRSTLPAPPVAEQRHVAALLRDIDAYRESASNRLATARATVERLRAALLAAACSGRLTADWRDERGAPTSGAPDALPATWEPTRLGDIVRIATGATPLRKNAAYYEDGTIPWVTSGAVNAGIISEPTEMITPLALRETNVKLFPPGTLLIAMYGEGQTRGRVAELAIEAGTNQALAAIIFDDTSAPFRPYLRVFFENGYQRMRAESVGGVQPNLSLGMFKDTVLSLPPLEEQRVIIERAAATLATAEQVRAAIASAEDSLIRASRAAVGRAFRCYVVPTGDKSKIGSNEPAHEDAD
jgi:type I restriction enzyme S subunit